jgi:plastocyanin
MPVSITEEGFDPPVVTIPVEGMVRWTNHGTRKHAVAGTLYTCYLPLIMRQ